MTFNADNVTSGDLVRSPGGDVGGEAVLRLSNGSVAMTVGPDTVSVGDGRLQTNQWYKVYATR